MDIHTVANKGMRELGKHSQWQNTLKNRPSLIVQMMKKHMYSSRDHEEKGLVYRETCKTVTGISSVAFNSWLYSSLINV